MIPNNENYDDEVDEEYEPDFEEYTEPSLTYAMNINEPKMLDEVKNTFTGRVDEEDAIAQAILKIIQTERYEYDIYSDDYGIELNDLRGMPMLYCMTEVPERIIDAVTADDRVDSVQINEVRRGNSKRALFVSFTAILGSMEIPIETEVEV